MKKIINDKIIDDVAENVPKLILLEKAKALFEDIYPSFRNFPRHDRFSMVHIIKVAFAELITHIEMANSVKSKRLFYAQEAEGKLRTITTMLGICGSSRVRYFGKSYYEEIDTRLTELKKLMTGYIKYSAKK